MRTSIRTKLIAAIGVPLVAVYLGMLALEYRLGKREALARMEAYLTAVTSNNARAMEVRFSTAAQVARTTAELLSLRPVTTREEVEAILRWNVAANEEIYGSSMAFEPGSFAAEGRFFAPYVCRDGTGLRVTNIEPGQGYDYTVWDWFLLPKLLGKSAWSDPYYDEGAGNVLMCTHSAPFYRAGKFWGVVGVDVSVARIRQALLSIDKGYCSIVSGTGTFISDPREELVMKESVFSLAEWHGSTELAALGREMLAGKRGVRRLTGVWSGEPMWVVYAPIPSTGWSMLSVVPEAAVLAPVYDRLARQLGVLLAGLVVLAGVILLVSITLTRPITRLAGVTRELAKGNLDAVVTGVTSRDEIGQLATTFNRMVADLKVNVAARVQEESARKAVESEVKVARAIQASLLPRRFPPFPERKEFDLHAVNEPAKIIAGDFFDFFFIDDDTLALVMADVSGKGVPAAMFMAVTRTAMRNFTAPGKTPGQILKQVNDVMTRDNDHDMFVTVFYGFYNVRTGDLDYANAGHNPPYVIRRGGGLDMLGPTGTILAAFEETEYMDRRVRLDPGDVLVLFTDGVTEANNGGPLYGTTAFERLLLDIGGQPVEEICQTVTRTVSEYSGHELRDDVTLLVLRRND